MRFKKSPDWNAASIAVTESFTDTHLPVTGRYIRQPESRSFLERLQAIIAAQRGLGGESRCKGRAEDLAVRP